MNEVSQRKKDKHYITLFLWGSKATKPPAIDNSMNLCS